MLARLVCSVFLVWLSAFAEQVTAVRDVLCLSHKPKSNRSESVVRVATEPLLLYPAYFRSLSPPVCHCVLCVIRRDLTQSITLGGRQVHLYLVAHHSGLLREFQLLGNRVTQPAIGVERSSPDQRTEPLDSYVVKSDVNSVWKIFQKNLPLFQ